MAVETFAGGLKIDRREAAAEDQERDRRSRIGDRGWKKKKRSSSTIKGGALDESAGKGNAKDSASG